MNSNSREIRRLNIKSFLIDVVFGVVTVATASVCLHFQSSVFLVALFVFARLFALLSFVYTFLCRLFSCYCLTRVHPSFDLNSH